MQAHVQCFVVHRVLEFFTYSTNCRNMELSQGYGNLPAYIPTQTTFAGDTHVPPYSGDASVPPYSGGTGVPPSQSLIGAAHVAPTPNPTIVHETPYMDDHAGFLQQKKFIQRLYFAINHDQTGAIRWNETGDAFVLDHGLFSLYYLYTGLFKSSKMTSFVRQMALYGFRKTDKPKMASLLSKEHAPIGMLDTGMIRREYKHPHFLRDDPTLINKIHRLQAVNPGSRTRKRSIQDGDASTEGSKRTRNDSAGGEESKEKDKYDDDVGTVPASHLPAPPPVQQFARTFGVPPMFPWINPIPQFPVFDPTTSNFNFMLPFAAAAAGFNLPGTEGSAISLIMQQAFADMFRNLTAGNFQQAPTPMPMASAREEPSQTAQSPPYTQAFSIRNAFQENQVPLESEGSVGSGGQYEPTDRQQSAVAYVPQCEATDGFVEQEKVCEGNDGKDLEIPQFKDENQRQKTESGNVGNESNEERASSSMAVISDAVASETQWY